MGLYGLGLLAGDLVQDLDDLLPLPHCHVDALGEFSLLVELVGPDDLAVYPEGVNCVQEGLHEVVSVVPVLSAGTRDPGDGHSDVLLILGREEIVPFPEGVEGVDEIDEPDLFAHTFDGAAHGFSRDCFP